MKFAKGLNTLEELLFDDIPFLEVAQAEHDAFAGILREEGVEVSAKRFPTGFFYNQPKPQVTYAF